MATSVYEVLNRGLMAALAAGDISPEEAKMANIYVALQEQLDDLAPRG